jgi:FAD/FMN-containing dehydrogenase
MSLRNQGDIDKQAIAGAISTGTHGTGHTLGSLSTQVVGMRIVTASGDVVTCSATQNPALFKAARVGLGAFGVVTRLTLSCEPAYMLHERQWDEPFDECHARLAERIAATRHFEFFWRPGSDLCNMKTLQPTNLAPGDVADLKGERVGPAYAIFPSERNTKFNEIEFSVPAENGPDCLVELRALMRSKYPEIVRWPLEYRTLKADDICLSTAQGRETVTISAHQAAELPYEAFFRDCEAIFRNHHGRPHWAKLHWHTGKELQNLYPEWDLFAKVREDVDPHGTFLNGYLRELVG